ncbi:hypothetical protein EX30DRAFT_375671 [Ascodesmis nigricans]|uniref:PIN domain-containing protein n=1 Tax=Ascodesmis nigricans TaxID=341454 RepID=A0A4V3SHH1_9PEZI|nr:hypothetical protein EX30DRAFT_375671 [Ascodesmis nigricans]
MTPNASRRDHAPSSSPKSVTPPTATTTPMQDLTPQSQLSPLERFAMARLQHTVNELEKLSLVIGGGNSSSRNGGGTAGGTDTSGPPPRKMFHCVVDETAWTRSIVELKNVVQDKAVTLLVPLATLDALDHLKKGTSLIAQNARETIRYLDRAQTSSRSTRLTSSVRFQSPSERFPELLLSAPPRRGLPELASELEPPTSTSSSSPEGNIRDVLNCVLFFQQQMAKRQQDDRTGRLRDDEVVLLTNNETLALWAREYGVRVEASDDIKVLVKREEVEWIERKRQWEYRNRVAAAGGNAGVVAASPGKGMLNTDCIPASPTRRRGGGGGGVGGGDFSNRGNPAMLQRRHTAGAIAPGNTRGNWGAIDGYTAPGEQVPEGLMDPDAFGRNGQIKVQDPPRGGRISGRGGLLMRPSPTNSPAGRGGERERERGRGRAGVLWVP